MAHPSICRQLRRRKQPRVRTAPSYCIASAMILTRSPSDANGFAESQVKRPRLREHYRSSAHRGCSHRGRGRRKQWSVRRYGPWRRHTHADAPKTFRAWPMIQTTSNASYRCSPPAVAALPARPSLPSMVSRTAALCRPKSSIASIRVNPDMFSSEYDRPPYQGGRVEIFTKPGRDSLHGALFFTDSESGLNATDPFAVSATPAGKRRYGFEFGGPIRKQKSDFFLALERRDIDEFNVVNAVVLNSEGEETPLSENVPAPQRLWIGSVRTDWQLSARNMLAATYSANINDSDNVGSGGLVIGGGRLQQHGERAGSAADRYLHAQPYPSARDPHRLHLEEHRGCTALDRAQPAGGRRFYWRGRHGRPFARSRARSRSG